MDKVVDDDSSSIPAFDISKPLTHTLSTDSVVDVI
jgi:hypothetical protein